ncbi:MAG: sulfurtransferase complex subunit TusD [Paraperlucidibaca sp.]
MRLSLLITAAPDSETAHHAWRFAEAALVAGHDIVRVFFADAGVLHGQALSTPARDFPSLCQRWQDLQKTTDIELVLCVSAALHYGVLDDANAKSWEQPHSSVADGFVVSGLGQLAEAQLQSQHLVTFPGAA